jgi:hypothetical protein
MTVDNFGFGMMLTSLRDPPSGSAVFKLPYVRQLKTRDVMVEVPPEDQQQQQEQEQQQQQRRRVTAAAAPPVFDRRTGKWVMPTTAASPPSSPTKTTTTTATAPTTKLVRMCPTGEAGVAICDVITAVNWLPFHSGGAQLLSGGGSNGSPVSSPREGYGGGVPPNPLKFGTFSMLRMVRRGQESLRARADDAVRQFRMFQRRRRQLLKGLRHAAKTGSVGLLARAVFDARFMPCLVQDEPLFKVAQRVLQGWVRLKEKREKEEEEKGKEKEEKENGDGGGAAGNPLGRLQQVRQCGV